MTVSEMMLEEWKLIRGHKFYTFGLVIPIVFTFFFGFVYSQEKIKHVPVRFLDESHSQLSQQIMQAFSASEAFDVEGTAQSEQELIDDVQYGRAFIGLVIPSDLSDHIKQGESGRIIAITDGSSLSIANTVLTNANTIISTYSIGISLKRVEAKGLPDSDVMSVLYGYRLLFNPGMSFLFFVPLGVMGVLIQNAALTSITLWIVREKSLGRWNTYYSFWRTPWQVYVARSFPYFLIILFAVICTSSVLKHVFHVPFIGDPGLLFLLSAFFILSVFGVASVLALLIQNIARVLQIVMFTALPSFILSGFTFPQMFMPKWVAALSNLLPLSHFLHALNEIAIKGNHWEQVSTDLKWLAGTFLLTSLLTLTIFSIQGRNYMMEQSAAECVL